MLLHPCHRDPRCGSPEPLGESGLGLGYGRLIAAHLDPLLAVVRAAVRGFEAAEHRPPASEPAVRLVVEAMESGELEPVHEVEEAARVAACRNLDDALTSARSVGGEVAELADAVGAVADMIAWRARRDAERLGPEFVAGHADTRILRSTGDRDVVIGLSLLAPHVRYPDHEHPPEEVYVVLSAGEWWHESGAWHEPGAGGVVYTPPGTSHAMRSSGQPLLAVWFQVGTSTGAQRVGSPG